MMSFQQFWRVVLCRHICDALGFRMMLTPSDNRKELIAEARDYVLYDDDFLSLYDACDMYKVCGVDCDGLREIIIGLING